MSDQDVSDRLAGIEMMLIEMRTEMATKVDLANFATKADLAEAVAGLAKNVDITALGKQIRQMQDELRVTTAMVIRLDHMWPDIIEQLRAMVQQQTGILSRVQALEQPDHD